MTEASTVLGAKTARENWLVIGGIYEDGVALDPVSGMVYSLPDGEYRARPLNQSLDSFVYFLYFSSTSARTLTSRCQKRSPTRRAWRCPSASE